VGTTSALLRPPPSKLQLQHTHPNTHSCAPNSTLTTSDIKFMLGVIPAVGTLTTRSSFVLIRTSVGSTSALWGPLPQSCSCTTPYLTTPDKRHKRQPPPHLQRHMKNKMQIHVILRYLYLSCAPLLAAPLRCCGPLPQSCSCSAAPPSGSHLAAMTAAAAADKQGVSAADGLRLAIPHS
jgi:hypothetical protein